MPSVSDETDTSTPRYNLRKRAKVTRSAATGVDRDVQQDRQDDIQDEEYDDPGESLEPAGPIATAKTQKRKRASPGGKAPKGPKHEVETQPAKVEDTSGSLAKMIELPLDLIYEILRHATPFDLLNLARTSKSFRRLLMNRSSRSVWLDAWRNGHRLPRCPSDMTPPAFTELLYGSCCHRCFTSVGTISWFWSARVRYCTKCHGFLHNTMKFTWHSIQCGYNPEGYPLDSLMPALYYHDCFRLEDISEFVQAWKRVPKSQQGSFLEKRKKAMIKRKKHEDRCNAWKVRCKAQKATEERLARFNRVTSVTDKLKGLGWTKVFDEMTPQQQNDFLALPDIRKDRRLTERIINNMLPRLITWLEKCQEVQERPLRRKIIMERIEQLDNALLPVSADHNINPSIRDIIVDMPEARTTIDVGLDATVSFDALLAALPAFAEQWRQNAYANLTEQIRQENYMQLQQEPLTLAVGEFFVCDDCSSIVSRTNVLNHHCPSQSGKFNRAQLRYHTSDPQIVYMDTAQAFLSLVPIFATGRRFRPCALRLSMIVEMCGYAPETASVDEMDASDARVVCLDCSTKQKRMIFTWRAAAHHFEQGNHREIERHDDVFRKATKAEAAAVKVQEDVVVQNYAVERKIHCAHCPRDERRVDYKIDDLIQHLTARHGVEEPSETDRFYDTTLPPICQDPVYMDVVARTVG